MSGRAVHFVRGEASYLPELKAYASHLAAIGWEAVEHANAGTVPPHAPVLWWICGRVPGDAPRRWPNAVQIHEYASASVPPAAALKDAVKRWTHPKPQHRVFQNDWVRGRMAFHDGVGHSLRDMGVPRDFLMASTAAAPEFDLVYLGETSRLQAFSRALEAIRHAGLSLVVVGTAGDDVRALAPWATFTGRVEQQDVPSHLLRARAGLNLVPDRVPFNEQTSTKALEYLACGLPVVGNDYAWFRRASLAHAGRMRALDVSSASAWREAMAALPALQEDRAHLEPLTWDARLKNLPVWALLP